MPHEIYPGEFYPSFCHGGMVILSYPQVHQLYHTALRTNITGLYLEDVLIFGILRHKGAPSVEREGSVDQYQVVPYGYQGSVTKVAPNEPLVYHFGAAKFLERRMIYFWNHSVLSLRFANLTLSGNHKNLLQDQFNAAVRGFRTLPDRTVNETVYYFRNFWDGVDGRV